MKKHADNLRKFRNRCNHISPVMFKCRGDPIDRYFAHFSCMFFNIMQSRTITFFSSNGDARWVGRWRVGLWSQNFTNAEASFIFCELRACVNSRIVARSSAYIWWKASLKKRQVIIVQLKWLVVMGLLPISIEILKAITIILNKCGRLSTSQIGARGRLSQREN